MKFLQKHKDSLILQNGWKYKGQSENDKRLRIELLNEQFNFCAYTERSLAHTDATEVEHFDPSIKYKDDYHNYYAVLSWANKKKIGKQYAGSRFFQDKELLDARVTYQNGRFKAIDKADSEAQDLIDFLGMNDQALFEDRKYHVNRLRKLFEGRFHGSIIQFMEYLAEHRQELSFPTAIEAEFRIDLTPIIQRTA